MSNKVGLVAFMRCQFRNNLKKGKSMGQKRLRTTDTKLNRVCCLITQIINYLEAFSRICFLLARFTRPPTGNLDFPPAPVFDFDDFFFGVFFQKEFVSIISKKNIFLNYQSVIELRQSYRK